MYLLPHPRSVSLAPGDERPHGLAMSDAWHIPFPKSSPGVTWSHDHCVCAMAWPRPASCSMPHLLSKKKTTIFALNEHKLFNTGENTFCACDPEPSRGLWSWASKEAANWACACFTVKENEDEGGRHHLLKATGPAHSTAGIQSTADAQKRPVCLLTLFHSPNTSLPFPIPLKEKWVMMSNTFWFV